MGTKSTISIENFDGSVKTIKCYFDGYLDGVGFRLFHHYGDRALLEKLINNGDIRCLTEKFNYTVNNDAKVTYYKDLDSYKNEIVKKTTFADFHSEYNYILLRDGKWFFQNKKLTKKTFSELTFLGYWPVVEENKNPKQAKELVLKEGENLEDLFYKNIICAIDFLKQCNFSDKDTILNWKIKEIRNSLKLIKLIKSEKNETAVANE